MGADIPSPMLASTDANVAPYNDTRTGPDAAGLLSCAIHGQGQADVGIRTALSDFDGVEDPPRRYNATHPRYGWCGGGDQPFLVTPGAERPGRPIDVAITNYIAFSDPNPCAED